MFVNIFQCQPDLSANFFRENTNKEITRFTSALILAAALGLYFSNIQAADFSCTWVGGPLEIGNWTDPNWNSDPGCSGTFPNNNGNTFDATLQSSATVTLDQDIVIQAFDFSRGTLTGPGNLTVNETFRWTGGTMSGTGTTRADGGLELDGNLKDILGGRKLVNGTGQTANWTSGSIRIFGTSQLVNEAGANFNITVDGGRMSGASNARFINAGLLLVDLSNPLENVQLDTPPLTNSGTVGVLTGELRVGGGGTHTGSFQVVGPNARLNFSGGTHTLEASSSVLGSNVDFSFKDSGGTTTIEGTYDVQNTMITGNTVTFNTLSSFSFTGTLTQTGGFLGGSGDVVVTGETTLSGGVIQGPGRLITVGGLEINGNFLTITGVRRLLNIGVANWTSGGIRLNNTGTRIENAVGATFNIGENATMMIGGGGILGGSGEIGAFTNRGTVVVDRSDNASTLPFDVNFFNLGTLDLKGDKLAFGASIQQFDTGRILFDIGGLGAGEFDLLNIAELAILDGSLDISLVDLADPGNNTNPFMPAVGDIFDILTATTIFDIGLTLGGPDGALFDFDIVDLDASNQALRLRVVPIPATVWLFMSALFGIWRIGTRKSRQENMSVVAV